MPEDFDDILQLFYTSVHTSGKYHYTTAQLVARAPREPDRPAWKTRLESEALVLVAVRDGDLAGFADLTGEGELDHLYIHPHEQGKGVGKALMEQIEEAARQRGHSEVITCASRMARPFFLARGYEVVHSQTVELRGELLENFKMRKVLGGN